MFGSMVDIQSATAEISRGKKRRKKELECGPMPNVMAAQPNIGGALCESCVIGSRQVTIMFVMSVGLFVCLCRVFLSHL